MSLPDILEKFNSSYISEVNEQNITCGQPGSSMLNNIVFGGIPITIIVGASIFVLLLLTFLLIQKVWDFGRLALVYQPSPHANEVMDLKQGVCFKLRAIFYTRSSDIYRRCGEDARHYLSFQREIILFLALASIVSLFLVLVVNMKGTRYGTEPSRFGRTVITNIVDKDSYLWLHVCAATSLCLIFIYRMSIHSLSIKYPDEDLLKHTIFIRGISPSADEETIRKHFKEAYPTCKVDSITLHKDTGMAYVIFSEKSMATLILKDFNAITCHRKPRSSVSDLLNSSSWSVVVSNYPEDIEWKNVSVRGIKWWAICLSINIPLFLLLLFFSTPAVIVSALDTLKITGPLYHLHALISRFLPAVLIRVFSLILSSMVYYSVIYEKHWSKCWENRLMLYKMFPFLIFMILISPAFGLTSINKFLEWMHDTSLADNIRLACLFRPYQGAFIVNYIISTAFISNGLDLLRFPGFLYYVYRLLKAKSAEERLKVKQNQAYDFSYGENYARILCNVTVIMAYSSTSPLVIPFGLFYLLLKHAIDRHNLYYVYLPPKVGRKIHDAAVTFSMAAPISCLLWLFLFFLLRKGLTVQTFTMATILLMVTTLILLKVVRAFIKPFLPFTYKMEKIKPTLQREDFSVIINIEGEEPQESDTDSVTEKPEEFTFYRNYP